MKKKLILLILLLVALSATSQSFGHEKDIPIFYGAVLGDTFIEMERANE